MNKPVDFIIHHNKLEKVILNGPNTDVVIPSTVSEIAPDAFKEAKKVRSVVIPASVSEIYRETFQDCMLLEYVHFSGPITYIGEYAFQNCKALKCVDLPEGLETLDTGTFSFCSSLESVNFPSSLTGLGSDCFRHCSSLREVILNEGLQYACAFAFDHCTALYKIYIPSTIELFDIKVFKNCGVLREIHYNPNVSKIVLADIRALQKLHGIESPIDQKKRKLKNFKQSVFYSLVIPEIEHLSKMLNCNIRFKKMAEKIRIQAIKGETSAKYDMRVCALKNVPSQLEKLRSYISIGLLSAK